MEARQYSLFPPLIHAPCPFTNTCTFVSPYTHTHKLLTCYSAEINAINYTDILSAPLTQIHPERHYTMPYDHKHSDDVILERQIIMHHYLAVPINRSTARQCTQN